MKNIVRDKKSESGNVLFLILIAVALFAALSYVVTQSTRSGGGSTEKEKNTLSSAQITQYPTSLRTALMRMVLNNVPVDSIRFNSPANFASLSTQYLVFHPAGGAGNYQDAPPDLSANGATTLIWSYNANFDVPGVGTDGVGGNDIIAFLPGVANGVCKQANEKLGVNTSGCAAGELQLGIPKANASITNANIVMGMVSAPSAYTFPVTDQQDIVGQGACAAVFNRQASGCFYDVAGATNVFYSVLMER